MRRCLSFIFVLASLCSVWAQCPPTPVTLDLRSLVIDADSSVYRQMSLNGGSGSNAFKPPATLSEYRSFVAAVTGALSGNYNDACALANWPSYKFLRVTDSFSSYLLVGEFSQANGTVATASPVRFWGTFAANSKASSRSVIITVPHPLYDTATATQGLEVFRRSDASLYILSGAHRCANDQASGCTTGVTQACSTSNSPFRMSDAGHANQTLFHQVSTRLFDLFPNAAVIQFHGNSNTFCPDILLSDGSLSTLTVTNPLQKIFADNVLSAISNYTLTFTLGRCKNGYPTTDCNLCGTDNIQGKYLAGAAGCGDTVSTPNGYTRFFHLEQHLGVRNDYRVMVDAIKATWAPTPTPTPSPSPSPNNGTTTSSASAIIGGFGLVCQRALLFFFFWNFI
eukprot:TRINITY_DN5055_c0_g1_i4.p1 TRINITY_DN5055_c0_g1~~TRINITY_DN5055_c0_g1_i4.p1  ORF type:complete len:396 (+),score=24.74 TRINITY_DN5055_c0_g1_i4:57-1244(+)